MEIMTWQELEELSPLEILSRCGGYYECPKDGNQNRLGPLVGYAGRDDNNRQLVGDIYVNFAKIEQHATVLRSIAELLDEEILKYLEEKQEDIHEFTGFVGAPMGGLALAVHLAHISDTQYIFPEKKIMALATEKSREESVLRFERHEPKKGDVVWIVEDVCNNFSTTADLVSLIEGAGATVAGIACFLNRSLSVDKEFSPRPGLILPVISVVRKPFGQYKQDDDFVKEDIETGNVVWKPKNKDEWARLMDAMKKHPR